uniref:F-box associated domain-containing protein n=1 Tax=Oryza barthii TaxID=65489 RepID=A0A0D3EP01_9ORYZ
MTTITSSPTRSMASSPTSAPPRHPCLNPTHWTALKAEKNKDEEGEEHRLVPNPSLSFLSRYRAIFPKDCCNGLILCVYKNYTRDESDYVVYNPATQRWIILPKIDRVNPVSTVRFSFDPALL